MKYKLKMVEIGKRIKENRKEMGITQYDLLEKLHIGRNTLSSIENGKKLPDAENFCECNFKNLFSFIKWEDEEAIAIEDILNDCEIVEEK